MNKPTKNIITRGWVAKELEFYNKANIRSNLLILCAISAFFLPITIILIFAILNNINNIFLDIILATFTSFLFFIPFFYQYSILKKYLSEKKLISSQLFEISVAELSYKDERAGRTTEYFLHFPGFDMVSVGHNIYDYASNNDKYYLVHYKGSNKVRLYYSDIAYEYDENN